MRVEVLYKSHRYEEFDSSPQTSSEPYRGKGTAVLMDWNLYLGDLEGQGIVLAQHWYDGSAGGGKVKLDGTDVPVAVRKVGCAMLLVAPEELPEVVWLKKDGEKILWREGDDLINKRALAVFDYLSNAHPDWDDGRVARTMGYTAPAIERIRDAELSQGEVFEEDGDSGEPEDEAAGAAPDFDFS